MFDNIGGKIKTLAKVICWAGIGFSIFFGLLVFIGCALSESGFFDVVIGFFLGILLIIIGSLASWIGSFFLYGFGELIERTAEIAQNTRGNSGDGWRN